MLCLKVLAGNKITQMAFRCNISLSKAAFSTLHPADPKGAQWSTKILFRKKKSHNQYKNNRGNWKGFGEVGLAKQS